MLYVSGTTADGTSNNGDRFLASHASPVAHVTSVFSSQSVGSWSCETWSTSTSFGASSFNSRSKAFCQTSMIPLAPRFIHDQCGGHCGIQRLDRWLHRDRHTQVRGVDDRRRQARALATDPALLLLDEPAAGLNPVEKQQLLQLIAQLKARGLTILLIEHDMQVVMPISDWIVVLDYGKNIAEGPPHMIQADPRVIEAYLGAPQIE